MGLRIIFFSPHLLRRTCQKCQTLQYKDDPTLPILSGELRCNQRTGEPWPRDFGIPTPCEKCPRVSPETFKDAEKTLDTTMQIVEMYNQVQATLGRCLDRDEVMNPWVAKRLGIIHEYQQLAQSEHLANLLLPLVRLQHGKV